MALGTVQDKVVVITGAGSGIGRALALRAASGGARIALSDWNPAGLAETARAVEQTGARVETAVVDVSDRGAVQTWAADVVTSFGGVDLVVNNAGVSATGDFVDLSYDDIDWILGINLNGVIHGSKEFLPHLIASGNGALVNISSLFGLVSMPGQSAYNATKYAVRGLTEAIREEMLVAGHPVTVTCVHPGGIRTGIARHGRKADNIKADEVDELFEQKLARMSPAKAAQIILDGALAGKARVLVGADAHAIHHFARLTGSRYQDVVARVARRVLPD
ncbi:MAG: Short-chain dehydrogenase [uncultured Nocardioides sp.]|uniref:Short-chain dehydrogenase n=1 Tax=uncultured Nocardioides sp. TaxID=198441 RepID=A0A6J4NHC4_9ACTN|nr:MAG: Short-chain dehydrogenase [uncultured Nocardioides sp.]